VVNKSQIVQLSNFVECGGSGEGRQTDDFAQGRTEIEAKQFQSDPDTSSDGSGSNIAELCSQEESELFELCKEIQTIVNEETATDVMNPELSTYDGSRKDGLSSIHSGNNICTNVTGMNTKPLTQQPVETGNCTRMNLVDYEMELENFAPTHSLELDAVDTRPDSLSQLLDCIESFKDINCTPSQDSELSTFVEHDTTVDHLSSSSSGNDILVAEDHVSDNNLVSSQDHLCSKTSDDDVFASEDILKDFDSILNQYNPDSMLNESTVSRTSSVDIGEEWNDLLSDLFPSLSSL